MAQEIKATGPLRASRDADLPRSHRQKSSRTRFDEWGELWYPYPPAPRRIIVAVPHILELSQVEVPR